MGAALVLQSSVAGGQPRAAERATLSRGQLPELGGINRVPPGLELDVVGRRLPNCRCVGPPARDSGAGQQRQPPRPGETKRDPKADPWKGVGERPRQTKGGRGRRRPQMGRGRGAETRETKRDRSASQRAARGGWAGLGETGSSGS